MGRFGAFLFGLILGGVIIWFVFVRPDQVKTRSISKTTTPEKVLPPQPKIDLRPEVIKEELSKTGKVIREKAEEAGEKIADITITTTIKGKLALEPDLSAREISVDTKDGIVTLIGTAPTPELIAKAISLAMETPGVKQVVSNLQIQPPNIVVPAPTTHSSLRQDSFERRQYYKWAQTIDL
jgi:hypothetical protein